MPDAGQEQDVAEEHREEPHGVQEGGGIRDAEGSRLEERQIEHGFGMPR